MSLSSIILKHTLIDKAVHFIGFILAFFIFLTLAALIIVLIQGSSLSIQQFGLMFVFSSEWNPVTQIFGGLIPLVGTLITSVIALTIALPISFGVSFFITQLNAQWLKLSLTILIELLAVIPSIIYGLWGLFIFAPSIGLNIATWLHAHFGDQIIIGKFFTESSGGINILTASIILGIMIIPFITSSMKNAFDLVPKLLKESAYGIGATTWEVVWHIVLPYTRIQVLAGVMLGLGRAIGETMAVTFVIGNAYNLSISLLSPGTTISSALANEFTEASSDLYTSALVNLGLIVFVITFFVLITSQFYLKRSKNGANK